MPAEKTSTERLQLITIDPKCEIKLINADAKHLLLLFALAFIFAIQAKTIHSNSIFSTLR